jgi:hypothetical protein
MNLWLSHQLSNTWKSSPKDKTPSAILSGWVLNLSVLKFFLSEQDPSIVYQTVFSENFKGNFKTAILEI